MTNKTEKTIISSDDFEYLLAYARIVAYDNAVVFEAKHESNRDKIDKIIQKNNLTNLSQDQFMEIANQVSPIVHAKKKIRENKVNNFKNMTTEEIAKLSLEEKVDYLDAIFHVGVSKEKLDNICTENKEQLKALLYNIQYPKDFFKTEEQQADRFISLVSNNHLITDNMKNWQDISLEKKKDTIKETAKVIEYVYGSSLNIDFFTPEEYRKRNNLDENAHVCGAYQSKGKIFFNTERLDSDNFMGVSVLFHEFMHQRQHEVDFNNPSINKLFALSGMLYNTYEHEKRNVAATSTEFGDFYSLMPNEVHAFAMQKYVEDGIVEKTGIEKTKENTSSTIKQMHDKSFTMASISKYRSN